MKKNIFEVVEDTLKTNDKYVSENGKLLKAIVYSDVMMMDKTLLSLLVSNHKIKETFFKNIDGIFVFDKQKFAWFIESKEFLPYKNEVDFYFVNLNSKVKKHEPNDFANYFNRNFIGIYLSKQEVMHVDRNFGLYHAVSLRDENEIEHTDNLYMLERDGEKVILKHFYLNKFLQKEMLIEDIKNINKNIQ